MLRFTHTTRRAKVLNIASNPYVVLSVLNPERPYQYLQVRGMVETATPDPGAFYVELTHRYGEPNAVPPSDAPERVVIAVRSFAYSTR